MKKRTVDEFKNQAIKLKLTRWDIHDCSMCRYHCGFIFVIGDRVVYDNGCGCSPQPPRPSSWDEVANQYNMQSNKEVIKEMDEFWGFR